MGQISQPQNLNSDIFVPVLPNAKYWLSGIDIPRRVAVAWSGGADSTALLLALAACGHSVEAWHVDHGWHASSAAQAEMLQARAAEWGIPFVTSRLEAPATVNREATARQARYALFARWGSERNLHALCLGHHMDDQAETVCLRLLQGSGVMGCRGMRVAHTVGGLQLMRPLLHLRRDKLREALAEAGAPWLEDPSNTDLSLLRNRIRLQLFPAIQRAGTDPVNLFMRWQRQAILLSEQLSAQLRGLAYSLGDAQVSIPWKVWMEKPAPVRALILQEMASRLRGEGVVLGRRHIQLAEKWLRDGAAGGIDLSKTRLWRDKRYLHLSLAPAKFR